MAFELFRQAFLDNFFEVYFYIMSSSSYEFYLAFFYNLLAVFYFIFMLYALNIITFLRYNFLNDIYTARWLRYVVRLSFNASEEEYSTILQELAFYGYLILTGLEVLIKSSFVLIVGWFSFKFPYLNFDPEPSASWKFADFFTKSRFYARRLDPSRSSTNSCVRGHNLYSISGDYDRGYFFRDFYPPKNFIQFQDPYTYFSKQLENPSNSIWKSFRYRQRILLFERARILSNRHYNWSAHIGGSRLDQSFLSEVSVPRHLYEAPKTTFFRPKSLELRPIDELFSQYYRVEDISAPISSRHRFLSRLWLPGKNSKNMTSSLFHEPRDEQERKMRMHNREKPIMNLLFQAWEADNLDPLLARYAAKLKQKKISSQEMESLDPFGPYKDELKDKVSDRIKSRWNDYNRLLDRYDSSLEDFDGEDFNFYYDESEEKFKKKLNVSSFYFSYGGENTVFEPEEVEFRRYLRRLAKLPTDIESKNLLVRSRFNAPHTEDIPSRKSLMEDSTLSWHSSENKARKSIYYLRGSQVYRRGLFDFLSLGVLRFFRRSTDFMFSKSFSRTRSPFTHDSVIGDDIFGPKIDNLKRANKLRDEAVFDDQVRPLFWRGRQDLSSLYGSVGNSYGLLHNFDNPSAFLRDRSGAMSFFDVPSSKYSELASRRFANANRDRLLVNRGFFAFSESQIGESLFYKVPRKQAPVYSVGAYSFYFQFIRLLYRFVSDHFLFWVRAFVNYLGFSTHIIPERMFPFRPGLESHGKSTAFLIVRALYFIRKLFRVIIFRGLSYNNPPVRPASSRSSLAFEELDDFNKQVLFRTFSSCIFRFMFLFLAFLAYSLLSMFDLMLVFGVNHPLIILVLSSICIVTFFKLYKPARDGSVSRFWLKVTARLKNFLLWFAFPARLFWRLLKSIMGIANRQGYAAWHARDVGEDEVSYQTRIFGLYADNFGDFLESLRKIIFRGARSSIEFDQFVTRFRSRSISKVSEYSTAFKRMIKALFADCLLALWYFLKRKLFLSRSTKFISSFAKFVSWLFSCVLSFPCHLLSIRKNLPFDNIVRNGNISRFIRLRARYRLIILVITLLFCRIVYMFWFLLSKFVFRSLNMKMYRSASYSPNLFDIAISRLRAYGRIVLLFLKTKVLRKVRFKVEEALWDIRSWFDS